MPININIPIDINTTPSEPIAHEELVQVIKDGPTDAIVDQPKIYDNEASGSGPAADSKSADSQKSAIKSVTTTMNSPSAPTVPEINTVSHKTEPETSTEIEETTTVEGTVDNMQPSTNTSPKSSSDDSTGHAPRPSDITALWDNKMKPYLDNHFENAFIFSIISVIIASLTLVFVGFSLRGNGDADDKAAALMQRILTLENELAGVKKELVSVKEELAQVKDGRSGGGIPQPEEPVNAEAPV